jgi:signal transduction histidine kinase
LAESQKRVLVIDDEEHVREFLRAALKSAGYEAEAVGSGDEGVDLFERRPVPLVISDLRMPGRDGLEVLREVRRIRPQTVVVILTGYGSVENAVTLMREGAFGILTKPCSIQEILVTVEKGLRHHELTCQNEELQRQLDRSQRLAMIGKLAAGVAHELNSPLDGVLRFVKLSIETLEEEHEARGWLEEARRGLDRMASIVRSLLTFSRNVVLEHEEAGLRELLTEAVRSIRIVLQSRDVELVLGRLPEDLTVPKGMIQVFTNVLRNAIDAVGDAGTVTTDAAVEGGDVVIRIRDDGPGIPEDIRERIFEPFFTTKEAGRGTGLGLPICARIMQRFNGGIDLRNAPGGGTIVSLRLPLASNARLATVDRARE